MASNSSSAVSPVDNFINHYFRFHRWPENRADLELQKLNSMQRAELMIKAAERFSEFTYMTGITIEKIIQFSKMVTAVEWSWIVKNTQLHKDVRKQIRKHLDMSGMKALNLF